MSSQRGRNSRAQRLGLPGPLHLVAMDHGLSMGWTTSQDPPQQVVESCRQHGLQGAICHPGLLDRMAPAKGFEVLLQLHGSTSADRTKSRTAQPMLAVESDCVGVAVEFQSTGPSQALTVTSDLIQTAHDLGLLVLVMANYLGESYADAAIAVVGAGQLDADIIKVRLPEHKPTSAERKQLRRIIEESCPVLVAGGNPTSDLALTLGNAASLGMSGTCIGRHYFDSDTRTRAVSEVKSLFSREP